MRSTSAARARLLDATSSLLADGGLPAATSRAIAAAAGENLGAITYYYGSKQNLVTAAYTRSARRLIAPVVAQLGSGNGDPADRLLAAVAELQATLDENRAALAGYVQCLAGAAHHPSTRAEINDLHADLAAVLESEMRRQRSDRSIPGWVDPAAMAQLIVALVDGVAVRAAIDPAGTDHVAIAGQFVRLLLASSAVDHR